MVYSEIRKILGGQKVIHKRITSQMDLIELSRRGIPKCALTNLEKCLRVSPKQLAMLLPITERTIQRYSPEQTFSPSVSEHILKISAVAAQGIETFDDRDRFLSWMNQPNAALSNETPMSLISSSFGIDMVVDELGRIEHGILS
jgi:putative toxin-antitoxin system antitoxin component (TIGR02293 family)